MVRKLMAILAVLALMVTLGMAREGGGQGSEHRGGGQGTEH